MATQRDREIERDAAAVREYVEATRDHLTADDVRYGTLVSFEHRGGRHVGKVKAFGKRGATVVTRSGREFLAHYGGLRAAGWPGAIVTAMCGDAEHTGIVKAVKGNRITVRLTTPNYDGRDDLGLLYANEIARVRDRDGLGE